MGESSNLRKPFKLWKKNTKNKKNPTPLITDGITFETYAMDNFYRDDHENHLEKTHKEFKNMFKLFVSPPIEDKDEEGEEEEEEELHIQTIILYWDVDPKIKVEDESVGEICTNDYDLRSKGALASSSDPSTLDLPKKSTNRTKATSPSTTRSKKVSPSKEVSTPKAINMNYNIVENMKRMRVDISMFELSKLGLQQ